MDERDWLAERFEEHRSRLRAVAYRMLGSVSEADDAVQEAWLRLSHSDAGEIENLGAWLTTVVGRVSLDMLRSQGSRREEHLGVHVPEPIVDRADGTDPEHEALLADPSVWRRLLHGDEARALASLRLSPQIPGTATRSNTCGEVMTLSG
jgi:RNA polymerase sigma-70 factor, ECF subfamily